MSRLLEEPFSCVHYNRNSNNIITVHKTFWEGGYFFFDPIAKFQIIFSRLKLPHPIVSPPNQFFFFRLARMYFLLFLKSSSMSSQPSESLMSNFCFNIFLSFSVFFIISFRIFAFPSSASWIFWSHSFVRTSAFCLNALFTL